MVYLGKDRVNLNPNFATTLGNNASDSNDDTLYIELTGSIMSDFLNSKSSNDTEEINAYEIYNHLKNNKPVKLVYHDSTDNLAIYTAEDNEFQQINNVDLYCFSACGYSFYNTQQTDGEYEIYNLKLYFAGSVQSQGEVYTLQLTNPSFFVKVLGK